MKSFSDPYLDDYFSFGANGIAVGNFQNRRVMWPRNFHASWKCDVWYWLMMTAYQLLSFVSSINIYKAIERLVMEIISKNFYEKSVSDMHSDNSARKIIQS
ncbi:unnamed protein product [Thelazia callipaeda]|uniref:Innexin n=1 Tax=Thelazia callipaeda TaxID=103827 RepID=A0A0N5CU45_THECL|nr:unnamed protein product [Thelazia callipaeda]